MLKEQFGFEAVGWFALLFFHLSVRAQDSLVRGGSNLAHARQRRSESDRVLRDGVQLFGGGKRLGYSSISILWKMVNQFIYKAH